jgi:cell division protein FtsB
MITKTERRKKRKSFQGIFFSVLIGALLVGVIGFLIVSNIKISQKRSELTAKIESLNKEINILKERKERLESGIEDAESEAYWEEKLREQGYKKPGEEAVVVLPPEEQEEVTEEEQSFWEKILDKLGF